MSASRPEHQAPPEIYYGDDEAQKYTNSSRYQKIQGEMSERAIELLSLPAGESCLLLDIGCGSGLSGEILEDQGHLWVGMDISPSMLQVALEREVEGDLFLADIGQGFGLRPGSFDGAISISVLQWLCNADKAHHHPAARLALFLSTLYSALRRGSRAVFQLYPESDAQIRLIMNAATKAGFEGGLVVDYPNSKKAKKFYLCLFAGAKPVMPRAKTGDMTESMDLDERSDVNEGHTASQSATIPYSKSLTGKPAGRSHKKSRLTSSTSSALPGTRAYIIERKARMERRGKPLEDIPRTSKFTGRKRKVRF